MEEGSIQEVFDETIQNTVRIPLVIRSIFGTVNITGGRGFYPGVKKIPWRRKWHTAQYSYFEIPIDERSLACYSP